MLTRTSMKWPRLVLALWFIATAVLAVFALKLPDDVKAGGFNDQNGSAFVGQQLNESAFHDPANELAVVLHSPVKVGTADVEEATQAARKITGVTSVTDARTRPQLASADRHTQVLVVGFNSDNTTTQNQVKPLREKLQATFGSGPVKAHVTGAPALDYDLNIQSSEDAQHAEMIAFPLLILVLLVVYRALAPTLLTLTVAGISLMATQGIGDLLAHTFDISNMYITGASLIGLAVSVDYCLFVLKRHEEFVGVGYQPTEAIVAAGRTAGHAVRFGGGAVIAALCTLFIPRNMVFTSIAAAGIIVTVLAILLTATFLPAAVSVLGGRTFWGKLPGFSQRTSDRTASPTTGMALRVPVLVAALLGLVFVALATPLASLHLRVPVASASILPDGADSRRGIETMNAGMDSRALFPTMVVVSSSSLDGVLKTTEQVDNKARSLRSASSVVSAASDQNRLGEVRRAVENHGTYSSRDMPLVTRNGKVYVSRVVVTSRGTPDSSSAHDMTRALRASAAALPGTVQVTGATSQGDDFDDLVEGSVPWILLSVAVVSIVLLGYAFRTFWLPFIAIGLNALVVSAAMGTLTLVWKAATGADINSVTPIVLFAIIFGLSMDYMVLMANRMREEYWRSRDHQSAIRQGSHRTSRLVTSAAVIMIAVFLSFFVAKISIVRELGTGLAIAVFFDAFLVRALLMPAVLAALGERVWGRSKPAGLENQVPHADDAPTTA